MEKPRDRYWVTIVGDNPRSEDREFIEHRASFITELVEFNELREARALRKRLLDNATRGEHTSGLMTKVDLAPESEAIGACLKKLHRKLGL
jgi:hypothetical protein